MTLTQKVQEAELVHDICFGTAPAEYIYAEMEKIWHEVAELFSVGSPGTPPTLVMYKNSSEIKADIWPALNEDGVRYALNEIQRSRILTAFYEKTPHMVFLDRDEADTPSLVEEVTHSLIDPTRFPTSLPLKQLREFSGQYFRGLYQAAKSHIRSRMFLVDISEFFPPLAEQALLDYASGSELVNHACLRRRPFQNLQAVHHDRLAVINLLHHIPRIAGERLVMNYEYDVQRLLHEHPALTSMSGEELWHNYCMPLLVTGKVEGEGSR